MQYGADSRLMDGGRRRWMACAGWSAGALLWLALAPAAPAYAAHRHHAAPPAADGGKGQPAQPAPAEGQPAPAPPEDAGQAGVQAGTANGGDTAKDTGPDASNGAAGEDKAAAEPDAARRSTPADAAAEMAWVRQKINKDPFLQPIAPVGPAPDVKDFYNPLKRLNPELTPHLSTYLVQDASGHIVGHLSLQVERQVSPLFGPVFHCLMQPDFSDRKQLAVWQSALTGKPLRVLRSATSVLTPSLPPAQGASRAAPKVLSTETLDATYFFDRAVISKDGGPVTLSARKRLLPYSFDIAQLPLLLTELDFDHADWPFEAALYDPATLQPVPLQVNRPQRKDVLTAEPATCACWELPVRLGTMQLTWYVERAAPHRLVKFQLGTYVYTLQQYESGAQP